MMQLSNDLFAALIKSYHKNAEDYLAVLIGRASDDEIDKASADATCRLLATLEPSVIELGEKLDYKNSRYYRLDPASTNAVEDETDFDKARTNLNYQYGLVRLITHLFESEHVKLYAKIDSLPTLRKLYRINLAYSKQLESEKSTATPGNQLIDINTKLTLLGLERRYLTNEISQRILHTQNTNDHIKSSDADRRSIETDEHILNNKKSDLDTYANQINCLNKILHNFYNCWCQKKYLAALQSESKKILYCQDIAQFETIDALLNQSYESLKEKGKVVLEKHQNTIKEIKELNLTIRAKKFVGSTEAPIEERITQRLTNAQKSINTIAPFLKRMLAAAESAEWSRALDESLVIINHYCSAVNRVNRARNKTLTKTPADFVPMLASDKERFDKAKEGAIKYYTQIAEQIELYQRALQIVSSFQDETNEPETPAPAKKKQRMS